MKFFILSALLAVAAASAIPYGANSYEAAPHEVREQPMYATITQQEDIRNMDGSSKYSYASSDQITREESQYQKQIGAATGTAAQGYSSYIAPDGQKIETRWTADESGYHATGAHLPVAPAVPAEIAAMLPTLPKLTPEQWSADHASQPAYQAPQYHAAAYDAPKYESPKYEAPKYDVPKYAAPKYDAPKYEAPKVAEPKYEAPRVAVPLVSAPKYEAPRYQAPAVPAPVAPAPAPAKPSNMRYY